ncbi:hypothetical protein [Natrinema salaciae]|uniref:Uncharacterized protein n=1 Tax=Natrinema salaciae TaxID=1186196 RepID=A0A1H9QIC6_9EURY|nr:hypothetical protein [Natrinema salaciae]SER60311.1 hypothetical protein SAMN04489841_4203 [Natrinema salaciae]
MREALLYQTSIAICGGALGIRGLATLGPSGGTLVPLLQAIAGIGMVATVIYDVAVVDEPVVPDERIVWFVALCALVVIITGVLPLVT